MYNEDNSCNYDYKDHYEAFVRRLKSIGFHYVDSGSFRHVYCRRNIVIKIPKNYNGEIDNIMEAKAYRKYKNRPTNLGLYLAPCRMLPDNCLMMVKVNTPMLKDKYPVWANYDTIDRRQVGRYRNRIVAFDFALNLSERLEWEKSNGFTGSFFQNEWIYCHPELNVND
jgi:hypothetical protein